jgi:hypothetical protein
MGKGGGGSQPTQQTVTQTNLPEYARPYFENIMDRAQAQSYQQYVPYENERIAYFTPGQLQTQQEVMGMQNQPQFNKATQIASDAAMKAAQIGENFQPGQFEYQQIKDPQLYTDRISAAQLSGPQEFTSETAQQYMSPYMQNVVDVQKREALRDAQIAQLGQNLGAARQGTLGGARQALLTGERERGLRTQLGDIQAAGSEKAFAQAQQQFERDRAAKTNVGLANLTNEQQTRVLNESNRLQSMGMNQQAALQTALANQQAGLQTQQMGEQSRQFGANLGLQGLQQAMAGSQILGGLGTAQQESQLRRLQAQGAVGAEQRGYQQQLLDQAYADFLRQRDYPMEQLGYFSNLMRGIPVGLSSTQTSYAAPPSAASQLTGAGIGAIGLSRLMGGG